jgi:hypothetical protein
MAGAEANTRGTAIVIRSLTLIKLFQVISPFVASCSASRRNDLLGFISTLER